MPELTRKERAAARDAEAARLAALDAALLVLTDADCAAKEALHAARAAAAERLTATKPLGQRLADARRKHERAAAKVHAAEEEARRAAERAATALEEEHAAATAVADLEAELLNVRVSPPTEVRAPAAALLEGVSAWAQAAGMALPADVLAAASQLKEALAPPANTSNDSPVESTPTDLAAALSPTEAADSGAEDDHMADASVAIRSPANAPADDAAVRRRRDGPYARSTSC